MRLRLDRCLIPLLVFACAAGPAAAAQWIQVEIIAFRYVQQEAGSWSSAKTLPDFSTAVRLSPASATAVAAPLAYQTLAAHELRLAGAYQALARSGNLERLFHTGWRQREQDSRAVFLSSAASTPAEAVSLAPATGSLEGSVRISPASTGFQLASSFVVQEHDTPIALVESRKMAVDELHYLDHPLVGLLIEVSVLTPAAHADGSALPLPEVSSAHGDAGTKAHQRALISKNEPTHFSGPFLSGAKILDRAE